MLRISTLGQDKVTTDKNHYTDNADMYKTHLLTLPPRKLHHRMWKTKAHYILFKESSNETFCLHLSSLGTTLFIPAKTVDSSARFQSL